MKVNWRTIWLWVVLILTFVAIFQFANESERPSATKWLTVSAIVGLVVGPIVYAQRRHTQAVASSQVGLQLLMSGRASQAVEVFRSTPSCRS